MVEIRHRKFKSYGQVARDRDEFISWLTDEDWYGLTSEPLSPAPSVSQALDDRAREGDWLEGYPFNFASEDEERRAEGFIASSRDDDE